MEDDFDRRASEDLAELREQLKYYSTEELCEILDEYIHVVGREHTIGIKEYDLYIEFLAKEINKRFKND